MRVDDRRVGEVTVRPGLTASAIYAGWIFGASALLVLGWVAVLGTTGPLPPGAFVAFGLLFVAFLLPVALMRCKLTDRGVYVRNYFRSYSFSWTELVAVELANPNPLLTLEASWTWLPRFRLQGGRSVDARAVVHVSRGRARTFAGFLERKAGEFGFDLDIDPEALRR